MKNPVKIWKELKEIYQKYIDSGFPLSEKVLSLERRHLLDHSAAICQPPIIEFVPKYNEDCTLLEFCIATKVDHDFAAFSNTGLFPSFSGKERKLYSHQRESLANALIDRKHIVVTTGTGSGKTECFLLPVVHDLIKESKRWDKDRKRAVRTLILYPLNALAEDQMVRMRRSLNSHRVDFSGSRDWLDQNRKGNRFYFGRYTGMTPGKGKRGVSVEYNVEKKALIDSWTSAKEKFELSNPDMLDHVVCMEDGSAEMWDRWSMQDNPPDILITNYSMLNIMLTREREASIFKQTKEWLAQSPDNIFHLVVDELHAYRGTSGTEVAYLIRCFLDAIGLTSDCSQLQILASSASLPDNEKSYEYLRDFFGFNDLSLSRVSIIRSKESELQPLLGTNLPFNELDRISYELNDIESDKIEDYLLRRLNANNFHELIERWEVDNRIRHLIHENENKRAFQFPFLANYLFGTNENAGNAMEVLLIILNYAKDNSGLPTMPMRAHYFFKNLDGLWACSNPQCSQVADNHKWDGRNIGKLYRMPKSICNCGSRIFEVSICKSCGEVFLGGFLMQIGRDFLLVSDRDLAGKDAQYCSIWPNSYVDDSEDDEYYENDAPKWSYNYFDHLTGVVSKKRGETAIYWSNPGESQMHPCDCPKCGAEGKNVGRDLVVPIGKHITGVQKVNQLMADALIRTMKSQGQSDAKLVLFSDSRQAAAKLSAGIELDHYRDVLRQIIIRSLNGEDNNKLLLRSYRTDAGSLNKEEKEIVSRLSNEDYYSRFIFKILKERDGLLDKQGVEELDQFFLSDGIKVEKIESEVWNELAKLGINPAGPYPSYFSSENVNWSELFRWEGNTVQLVDSFGRSKRLFEGIMNKCRTEQMITLFAHKKKSFEALKVGFISLNLKTNDELFNQFVDVCIRLLGENWRIQGYESKYRREGFPRPILKYAKKVFGDINKPGKRPNLDRLRKVLQEMDVISKDEMVLTGKRLYFRKSVPGDKVWECERCHTIHLHPSCKRCTNCLNELNNVYLLTSAALNDPDDYYMYIATTADPFRLHCEELTGQTSRDKSIQRQRNFQGIFTGDENKVVDEIDLLSVTTTMEAGVDIGSLSAVMMGNVPPQRFNYQQRVGRAGRRGQSLSIALTIAKMNSHDQTHYFQTERMVSATPSSPYIEIRSSEIAERMIVKQILYKAFKSLDIPASFNDNVHGQFGSGAMWYKNRSSVEKWIRENSLEIERIVKSITRKGLNKTNEEITTYIQEDLLLRIDDVVARTREFPQKELSEKLANAGYLPMFGFPTKVRYFYHKRPDSLPPESAVSRELDLAISMFAPGSEIVKDKQVFTSVGFVHYELSKGQRPEEEYGLNELEISVKSCKKCGFTTTKDENYEECPICDSNLELITACSPLGFCVDYEADEKDFNGRFDWRPIKMDVNLDTRSELISQPSVGNLSILVNTVPQKGLVHYVNSNNGKFFNVGRLQGTKQYGVLDSFDDNRKAQIRIVSPKKYALIASKTTGVLALGLKYTRFEVDLDPLRDDFTGDLVKAAFRSWGYLLRKAICSYLEIEANEIDVGFHVNEGKEGEVFLVERLENGAGYCTHLSGIRDINIPNEALIKPLLIGGEIYNLLNSEKHGSECSHSCYDCIRDFNNQHYHSKLNWRLGLDLATLAGDSSAEIGFNKDYWKTHFEDTVSQLSIRMKCKTKIIEPGIAVLYSESFNYLITHPFWSKSYVESLVARIDKKLNPLNIYEAIRKSKL
jgi:Lhr-like helicase